MVDRASVNSDSESKLSSEICRQKSLSETGISLILLKYSKFETYLIKLRQVELHISLPSAMACHGTEATRCPSILLKHIAETRQGASLSG